MNLELEIYYSDDPYQIYCIAVVLYAVSAVYFAGVMVRLMLTLTPIVCILASIAFSRSLDNYMKPVFSQSNGGE